MSDLTNKDKLVYGALAIILLAALTQLHAQGKLPGATPTPFPPLPESVVHVPAFVQVVQTQGYAPQTANLQYVFEQANWELSKTGYVFDFHVTNVTPSATEIQAFLRTNNAESVFVSTSNAQLKVRNDALNVVVFGGSTGLFKVNGTNANNQTVTYDAQGVTYHRNALVLINGDALNAGSALAHEIGHAFCLTHVDDASNLMKPLLDSHSAGLTALQISTFRYCVEHPEYAKSTPLGLSINVQTTH